MRRVTRLEVAGMLGRFNHVVEFPAEWEFVIIHGPNGVGKTKLLELVGAIFAFRTSRLSRMPFSEAAIDFDDGARLVVKRTPAKLPIEAGHIRLRRPRALHDDDGAQRAVRGDLAFHLKKRKSSKPIIWRSKVDDHHNLVDISVHLDAILPIDQVGPDAFRDYDSGELLSLREVVDKYEAMLPEPLVSRVPSEPKEIKEFLSETNVYLIETQRLLSLPVPSSQRRRGSARERSERDLPRSTVVEYSVDLTRRLREALAQNSRTSQELDRTFPGRLLRQEASGVTDDQIREMYNRQVDLRKRLAQIDIISASEEHIPLPDRPLEEWERRVLWAYLGDAEKKLGTFEDFLNPAQLLLEIVNARFLYKTLSISRDRGFSVVTDDDMRQEIPPDQLSSGEQHELVLVYDLLFQVEKDTLVLIDEPEISLHVGWQRQFLQDLFRISQLTSLRFIIATHSPQIIHKWWDRTVSLAPDDETDS